MSLNRIVLAYVDGNGRPHAVAATYDNSTYASLMTAIQTTGLTVVERSAANAAVFDSIVLPPSYLDEAGRTRVPAAGKRLRCPFTSAEKFTALTGISLTPNYQDGDLVTVPYTRPTGTVCRIRGVFKGAAKRFPGDVIVTHYDSTWPWEQDGAPADVRVPLSDLKPSRAPTSRTPKADREGKRTSLVSLMKKAPAAKIVEAVAALPTAKQAEVVLGVSALATNAASATVPAVANRPAAALPAPTAALPPPPRKRAAAPTAPSFDL